MPLGHRKTKHITAAKHRRSCMLGNHFYEKYSHSCVRLVQYPPLCSFLLVRRARKGVGQKTRTMNRMILTCRVIRQLITLDLLQTPLAYKSSSLIHRYYKNTDCSRFKLQYCSHSCSGFCELCFHPTINFPPHGNQCLFNELLIHIHLFCAWLVRHWQQLVSF